MQHLAYKDRYSVVPITSSMLTVTLHSSVRKTSIYNNRVSSASFMTLQLISTVYFTLTLTLLSHLFLKWDRTRASGLERLATNRLSLDTATTGENQSDYV